MVSIIAEVMSVFFCLIYKQNKIKFTTTQITMLRSKFGTVSEDAPEVYNNPLKTSSGLKWIQI